ncbi:Spc98 family-domain-containing protein [Parasitella parasitica]|nr:Spc98 family-domain-containing protein [Parasitella parasitica]
MLPFETQRSHQHLQHLQQLHKITIPLDMKKKHLQLLLSLYSSPASAKESGCLSSPWIRYPRQLQAIVSQVRRSTADWLFSQVLVGEHGLHRYLDSFRHVFLLNYGDLASNFIDECTLWRRRSLQKSDGISKIQSNPSKTAIIFRHQELNALLGKASIGTAAEDQLQGFKLLLQEEQTKKYPFADLLLLVDLRMVLTFDLEWPIDLFLSKSDLKNYSHLWSFLISLKNTQMSLGSLYQLLRCRQDDAGPVGAYHERMVWRTRTLMLFWVDTMWNHVQSQVIDVHYQKLTSSTSTSTSTSSEPTATRRKAWQSKPKLDFDEIQAAHEHFLRDTMRGCLLMSSDCVATMHDMLQSCLEFCDLMETISQDGRWRTNKRRKTAAKTATEIVNQWTKATTVSWMEDVVLLQERFNELAERFFVLTSSQQPDVKASGQLDVLLMQLDFNKWFSK